MSLAQRLRFRQHLGKRTGFGYLIGRDAGPLGHLLYLRKMVATLCRDERMELPWTKAVETRLYTERLLQEALVHGEASPVMLEMAHFWLQEPPLVQKLFDVLAPRFAEEEQQLLAAAAASVEQGAGGSLKKLRPQPMVMLYRLPRPRLAHPAEELHSSQGGAVVEIRGKSLPVNDESLLT